MHGADLSEAEVVWCEFRGMCNIKKCQFIRVFVGISQKDWNNLRSSIRDSLKIRISSIRDILKELGLADDVINDQIKNECCRKLKKIHCRKLKKIHQETFSFGLPTTPVATDCIFHSRKGPFKGWPEPGKGCDSGFISEMVDLACRNQWIAKGIVNRVTNEKSITDLIKALGINRLTNEKGIAAFIKPLGIVIRARPIKKDIDLVNCFT